MKKILLPFSLVLVIVFTGCSTNSSKQIKANDITSAATINKKDSLSIDPSYDLINGEGHFTNVNLAVALNKKMAENGEKIYHARCESCHDLSDAKRVGPGLKEITKRHTATWFMNFMTNTDVMLDKDPYAKEQLKKYKIRMTNQYLGDTATREVYEFMRKNDGVK